MFKPGDKVVYIPPRGSPRYFGTIIDIDESGIEKLLIDWSFNLGVWDRFPHDVPGLILESVYNSPLFKLMEEKDEV